MLQEAQRAKRGENGLSFPVHRSLIGRKYFGPSSRPLLPFKRAFP